MPAELLAPPGGYPPMLEGVRYKSPILVPTSDLPYVPFQEIRREPEAFEYPLQQRVDAELMGILGKDFMHTDAVDAFDERAARFGNLIRSLSPAERNGQLDKKTREIVERRGSCLRIAATVLATKLKYDLYKSMDAKLTERMATKYHPQAATELRVYGPPPTDEDPSPQPLDAGQTIAYLKSGWDEETHTQSYRIRGLSIPAEEQAARVPKRTFPNLMQELANEWQVSALGSNLVPEQRVANVIAPEIGETDEVMLEFRGMTDEDINALSPDNPQHAQKIADIGAELTDVIIGIDCYFAAIGIDVDKSDKAVMDQALKTFAEGPDLLDEGIGFKERMRYLEEKARRFARNHALPFPPTPKERVLVHNPRARRRAN